MSDESTLTKALAQFQGNLPKFGKGGVNPHYRNSYSTLEEIVSATMPALAAQGLAWTTCPTVEDGEFVLRYALRHVSGESIEGKYPLGTGNAQQRGSEISYARRYSMCAVLGLVADVDDDGHAASQAPKQAAPQPAEAAPVKMSEQAWKGWDDQLAAADTADAVRTIWQEAQKLNALNQVTPDGQQLGAVIQARAAVLK